jgi:hypothetical protein
MKVTKWMVGGLALVSASAFADARVLGFGELEQAMQEQVRAMQGWGDCAFVVSPSSKGLKLRLVAGENFGGEIEVREQYPTQLTEKIDSDGSYQREYAFKYAGKLTVIHADDAYDEIVLTDGESTVRCLLED